MLLALASPVGAQEAPWDGASALVGALQAEGCALTPESLPAVVASSGLLPDQIDRLVPALVRARLAEKAGAGVAVLTPIACSGTAPRVDLALVVRAAREAGCTLSRAEALAALAPLEAVEADADAVFDLLSDAGEAWTGGGVLHLSQGLCRGLPGAPAMVARREAEVGAWVEARLLREAGCALSRGTLAVEGVAVGIGPADIDRAVASLDARGRLSETGGSPRLSASACR